MTPTTDTDGLRDVLTETAPERVWLQVDLSGSPDERDEPFPDDHEGVSWCDEELGGQEVEYVRADKLAALAAKVAEAERLAQVRLRHLETAAAKVAANIEAREAAEADAARFAYFFDCNRMPNLGLGAMLTDDTRYTLDDWRGAIDRAMSTRDDSEAE